jgi:Tol biopolymer transport system component
MEESCMRPVRVIALGSALLILATLAGCGASGPAAPPATSVLIATPAGSQSGATPTTSIVYEGPIDGGAGIRIIGTDGDGDRWLFPDVKLPKDGWQVQPDWSRDGTRLAFAADDPADPPGAEFTRDLWVGDADGASARRVFNCVSPCIEANDPAWSPDGRRLAFATWGPQPASLAVLDLATGSMSLILTVDHDPDAFRHPRWSPNGRRIVLEHQTWTGGAEDHIVDAVIGVVDLDAPMPQFTPITEPAMWVAYPDWHPTEDRIVFSTRPWSELDDGPSNLYTIRPDGSGMTAMTNFSNDQSRAVQPTWTPDGKQVMFTKVEGMGFGNPTMAVIDADGTGLGPATGDAWLFGTHPRLRPTP